MFFLSQGLLWVPLHEICIYVCIAMNTYSHTCILVIINFERPSEGGIVKVGISMLDLQIWQAPEQSHDKVYGSAPAPRESAKPHQICEEFNGDFAVNLRKQMCLDGDGQLLR